MQVQRVSRRVLHDFWRRWYFPANATLFLVGDFNSKASRGLDAAETLVKEAFGSIPAARLPSNGVPGSLKQRHLVSICFCKVP